MVELRRAFTQNNLGQPLCRCNLPNSTAPARRLPAPRSGGRVEGRPPPQRPLHQDYDTLRRCKRGPTCLAGVAQARRRAEEVARVRLQSKLSHTCPDVLNKVLEDLRGTTPAAHPVPRPSPPPTDVKRRPVASLNRPHLTRTSCNALPATARRAGIPPPTLMWPALFFADISLGAGRGRQLGLTAGGREHTSPQVDA